MYNVILAIHILVCILVVLIVLIQAGRSGGFSGLFGGGGGDALFSTASQQSGLRKLTVGLAAVFMATSFFLTVLSSRRSASSVIDRQFPTLPPVSAGDRPAAGPSDAPAVPPAAPSPSSQNK